LYEFLHLRFTWYSNWPFSHRCRGVPVVLPYDGRYCTAVPDVNQSEWCGFHGIFHQHGAAAALGEPYVYMVNSQGPVDDIIKTVQKAVDTPIEPLWVWISLFFCLALIRCWQSTSRDDSRTPYPTYKRLFLYRLASIWTTETDRKWLGFVGEHKNTRVPA